MPCLSMLTVDLGVSPLLAKKLYKASCSSLLPHIYLWEKWLKIWLDLSVVELKLKLKHLHIGWKLHN
jgi:hypothetical protein